MSAIHSKSHVFLTLQHRYDILRKLESGISQSELAKEYGVTDVTIRRIKSNAVQIRQQFHIRQPIQISDVNDQDKSRLSQFDELNARLHTWFLNRRAIGFIVTDLLLQNRAKELNQELCGSSSFSASKGWLWRFKRRHGIRYFKHHRERTSANAGTAEELSQMFLRRLEEENIKLQNVYNMDETGLLWKAVSQRLLVHAGEKAIPGNKAKKDRVTVGLCVNATGTHKLPPIFINRYEKPRVLKHCRDQLPVIFKSQKNAVMDRNVFADWLKNHFRPAVRKQQFEKGTRGKVLLLLCNSECHALSPEDQTQDDNFEIVFFPANEASYLQPMSQGIIETMKKSYRHRMVKKILECPGGVEEFYKNYDIKDCISVVNEAWIDVKQLDICKSWEKILGDKPIMELEALGDRESSPGASNIIAIPGIVQTIADENIPQQDMEESFSSSSEADDDLELEASDRRCTEETCLRRELYMDKVEINRMFMNLVLWSKKQPKFIKTLVQSLKSFHEYTQR
ncbi:jerky protein homolog-like [Hylaeus volcanicus]|uniref:jerky protein homolog-like n=1 Tax=Hylaeus volcanicus TaxID=313075 RepID=UPI0023B7C9D6|nr:jerky protein homolog-like [Hylaeus volcanicus]